MGENKEYVEIDLLQWAKRIWQRAWIVVLAALLGGSAAFMITSGFITPLYKSSAMLYVNNSSFSLGSTSFSFSTSELSAAQSLVDTYIIILKTRATLNDVIEEADLGYSYDELLTMIDASAVEGTEVFKVSITSPDPYEAEKIANTIAVILPKKISDIVDGSDVRIVDYAVVPSQRSSPSIVRNTAIGLLVGVALSIIGIIVYELLDRFIRTEDYLTQYFANIPVLAAIPDLVSSPKRRGYYKYKSYKYYQNSYSYDRSNDTDKDGNNNDSIWKRFKKGR